MEQLLIAILRDAFKQGFDYDSDEGREAFTEYLERRGVHIMYGYGTREDALDVEQVYNF